MDNDVIRDNEITLDDWKPAIRERKLIQSKWRKDQIGENYNQEVSRDDLKKIKDAIKKKYPDHEIMQTYGINAQTLVDIKEGRVNPENGVSKGSLGVITDYDEYNSLSKKITVLQSRLYGINCAFKEVAKILFDEKEYQAEFLKLLEKKRGKVKKEDELQEED